jgi:hypothetical protein
MHLTTLEETKDYSNIFLDHRTNSLENIEILKILDENLNGEFRLIYLKLKNGSKVPKSDKDRLLSHIREILWQKNADN